MTTLKAINIECMLLGWAETHNGGAKIVLQLADPDDLEPFKAMTVAKGKLAGQRLALAIVEIGDDERPVESTAPKGGPLSRLAARWCQDESFQRWIGVNFPGSDDAEKLAAKRVRETCGVVSRAALDHDPQAAHLFHERIRIPYQIHLQQHANTP